MDAVRVREDVLFAEWKSGSTDRFVTDGLVDEACYAAAPRKVFFVLKDAYGEVTDLRDYLRDNAGGHTWTTVAHWTYGLLHLETNPAWEEIEAQTREIRQRKDVLRCTGSMNVKKTPSPQAATDDSLLEQAINDVRNREFLKRQWSLYNPDITICGHWKLFWCLVEILGGKGTYDRAPITRRGIRYWQVPEGGFLIESCHPAAQYPLHIKCFTVLDAARELLGLPPF